MKKLIVLAVIGLVIGIGGGTGAAIALRPATVPDSTAADSSNAHGDTTAVIAAAPVGEHAPAPVVDSVAVDTATKKPAEHVTAPAEPATHSPAPVPTLIEKPESDSLERAQVRRIGRIFAAMAPREASKVLQQLDDADVRVIIASLTEKQAAAILQAFPPERAAAISKSTLRAAQQGQRP